MVLSIVEQAVTSPGAHDEIRFAGDLEDPVIVLRSHGVGGAAHILRIGGTIREEVQHVERIVAPVSGEAANTTQGGVELVFIGR